MATLLIDTDVLIEYLRGRPPAREYFLSVADEELIVSAITVAELYAGARPGEEEQLADFLSIFSVVDLDAELARAAGELKYEYAHSHGTGLADAVIAATATRHDASLVTFNARHYPMVDAVTSPWER